MEGKSDESQTCTVEDTLVNEANLFPSRLVATDSQSFSAISSAYHCYNMGLPLAGLGCLSSTNKRDET